MEQKRKEFLEKMLICPVCGSRVVLAEKLGLEEEGFVCESCKLLYPIDGEIVLMHIDDAKRLDGRKAA